MTAEDMNKPQVGICSRLVRGQSLQHAPQRPGRQGQRKACRPPGCVGMRFNTIGVSDGISMGTDGMSYSLQSRDLIADSIETVMAAQWYDALVAIPGCDKNMPGCIMAMAPAQPPGASWSTAARSGPAAPRFAASRRSSTSSRPSSPMASASPARSPKRSGIAIVRNACPGAGACGGMYTANTMASSIECHGHVAAVLLVASRPRIRQSSRSACRPAQAIRRLLELDLKPRDIMTRKSFDNAMRLVIVLGGSTNAVLHSLAMARAFEHRADDGRLAAGQRPTTPLLCDLKPIGQVRHGGSARDRRHAGGDEDAARAGLLDGSSMTVTGKTLAENLAGPAPCAVRQGPGQQQIVQPLE